MPLCSFCRCGQNKTFACLVRQQAGRVRDAVVLCAHRRSAALMRRPFQSFWIVYDLESWPQKAGFCLEVPYRFF